MAFRIGIDGVLQYKVGGQDAAGSWLELTNTRDLTLNLEHAEADVTTRGSQGWRLTEPTLKDASIEWEMVWDPGDAGFVAIKDAWLAKELLGLAALDSDDGSGVRGDFKIISFSRSEPLEDAMTVSVTAKPAYSANPPQWVDAA